MNTEMRDEITDDELNQVTGGLERHAGGAAYFGLQPVWKGFNSAATICAVMVLQCAEVPNRPKLNLAHSSHLVGSWMSA